MFRFKNTLFGFLVLGIGIVFFIAIFALLLKLLILGLGIGMIIFAFFWLKNKLFPNSRHAEQFRRFTDSFNYARGSGGRTASRNSGAYTQSNRDDTDSNFGYQANNKDSVANRFKHAKTSQRRDKSGATGRIIDVEPEDS